MVLRSWVAATAVVALGWGQAVAQPVLQASATLSGLGYQVTDLTPSDGVDAFVRLEAPASGPVPYTTHFSFGRYASDSGFFEHVESVPASLFSGAASVTVTQPGAVGSVSGSGQSLTVAHDLADVRAFLGSVAIGSVDMPLVQTAASLSPLDSYRFVIGAHSSVTFSGWADPISTIAHESALNTPEMQRLLQAGHVVAMRAFTLVDMYFDDAQAPCCVDQPLAQASQELSILIDPVTGVSAEFSGDAAGPLSLTFSNDTDQEVTRGFSLRTIAAVTMNILPIPVPEPGTWALMGLGLFMVGLATRQQRRNSLSRSA